MCKQELYLSLGATVAVVSTVSNVLDVPTVFTLDKMVYAFELFSETHSKI